MDSIEKQPEKNISFRPRSTPSRNFMRLPYFSFVRCRAYFLACATALSIAGCWGSGDTDVEPDLEPKELTTKDDALTTEVPEFDLVRLSKKLYQVGMYTVARDSFSSLKDRYPLGAYSTFAEIKLADTYFFNREFDDAAKSYESFLKNFPGHVDAPYVKLQAARSHIASSRGGGRDRQPLERGLALLDEIGKEYPGTAYADIARDERMPVVTQLSSYDAEIIEFYKKLGNEAAVKDREQKFQARWGSQRSVQTVAADEDAVAPQVALANLSKVESPPPTRPSQDAPTSQARDVQAQAPHQLREGAIVVQNVTCHAAEIPFGSLEVTQIPSSLRATETVPREIAPEDGMVVIPSLDLTARRDRFSCFSEGDLEIRANGDLALRSEKAVSVSVVENPPRILISVTD